MSIEQFASGNWLPLLITAIVISAVAVTSYKDIKESEPSQRGIATLLVCCIAVMGIVLVWVSWDVLT